MCLYPMGSAYFEGQNHDYTLKVKAKLRTATLYADENQYCVRKTKVPLISCWRCERTGRLHAAGGLVSGPSSFERLGNTYES